jgi:hypothetical protein
LLLGLVRWDAYLPTAHATLAKPLALDALWSALLPLLLGAVLAILLGRWERPAPFGKMIVPLLGTARRAAFSLGWLIEEIDGTLRQWPAAAVALLAVAAMLGTAIVMGH